MSKQDQTESPNQHFFEQKIRELLPYIKEHPELHDALTKMRVTNIVATCNLDIKNIDLQRLAGEFFFCNYHKCTFAAMGFRLRHPWCAALLYSMGVIVCMGTTSQTQAVLACQKYIDVMNNQLGIKCHKTGFKIDNYVCSTLFFPLNLQLCTADNMNDCIEYDGKKFSGAILRCEFLKLGFHTDAVVTLFDSGNINITGSKSTDEAMFLLAVVYSRYLVRLDSRKHVCNEDRIKREPVYTADIEVPVVNRNVASIRQYRTHDIAVKKEKGMFDDDDDNEDMVPFAIISGKQEDMSDRMEMLVVDKNTKKGVKKEEVDYTDIERMVMSSTFNRSF